ncbi:V-set domain-containing T-cell activation inhibitor 1 [Pempheris klunzingeri]|uniref:V-set domain-containing T-cell activation inhibitor 1 n=1 Tax=Pempheris klunzingeri TaxID=3127111 RepID=UPI00397EC45D
MNMASTSIAFSILTVTLNIFSTGTATGAFVSMQCKAENVGQYGHQTLLECLIRPAQEVEDVKIRVVTWKKEGDERALLLFNRGKAKFQPGYSFAEPHWNDRNMNVSLLITNTATVDEGAYKCMVMTDSGDASIYISLKVTARYNAPTIHSTPKAITPNTGGTLTCNAHGGFPKGQLRWYDEHNTEWTKSSEMEAKQTESGLFTLSSKLILLQRSTFSKYTCVVYNASGGKEDEATFLLDTPTPEGQEQGKGLDQASKIVAPVVVIGSLIVGLLMALLFYKRRSLRGHEPAPTCESDAERDDHQETDIKYRDSLA